MKSSVFFTLKKNYVIQPYGNSRFFVFYLVVGVRFTSYHGNFMLRSTDLLALPAVDCDKAYAAQFSLEETLLATQTIYFQVVLLYPCLQNFLNGHSVYMCAYCVYPFSILEFISC